VFLASTATTTTSGGDSWSPGIAAAVAVPLGLAAVTAAVVTLAFAVRRRMGRDKRPAVQRRSSSVTTQFSLMHSSPNGMYDPSKQRELHQLNWQTKREYYSSKRKWPLALSLAFT
jgi:hypothetical protein